MLAQMQVGVSDAAESIRRQKREYTESLNSSVTLSRASSITSLIESFCEAIQSRDQEATPVQAATLLAAQKFLTAIAGHIPSPTVSIELDGHISFEWYRSRRNVISVSLADDGRLYWSALIGNEDPRGSAYFYDQVPRTIEYLIERVCFE